MHPSNHFYGHARVLARYCGLRGDPPLFGLLQHGWNVDHGIRDTTWLPAWFPKLVWNRRAVELARADGVPRLRGVGAPFLYLLKLREAEWRRARSMAHGTVAFPYHFWEEQGGVRQDRQLAADLADREIGPVTVCLYWYDHQRPEVRRVYEEQGFRVVTLGEREDPTFLDGLFDLVTSAERVVTNRASTAIWCGAAAGAEVSIYGPVFGLGSEEEGGAFARLQRERWPELCGGAVRAEDAIELGGVELGAEYVLDPASLRVGLGWTPSRVGAMRVARRGVRARSSVLHALTPPSGALANARGAGAIAARDLHVVVPTIGRDSVYDVVEDRVRSEKRLLRLTVVSQDCDPVLRPATLALAEQCGVVVDELRVEERIGCARARRAGVQGGSATYVGFCDDDISFDQGSLSDLVSRCEERGWGGASGAVTNDARDTGLYRLAKRLLFHGPFDDPRQRVAAAGRPRGSSVLSGGVTVFRRDLYERVSGVVEDFDGYSWGEDVIVSLAASDLEPLGLDPTVRVQNLAFGNAPVGSQGLDTTRERFAWYRRLATMRSRGLRDRLWYLGAVVGATAQGLREGPPVRVARLGAAELSWGARQIASGSSRP